MRRQGWIGILAGSAFIAALIGCGGSDGSTTGGGSGGGSGGGGSLKEQGTARVDVDAATGVVKVTPLGQEPSGNPQSRSLYTGSALSISSTSLFTDAGELTQKKLKLTIKNNTGDSISDARLVVDKITNSNSLDLRFFTNVTTVVGPGTSANDGPALNVTINNPNGIARDTDGTTYITGFGDGSLRKLSNGFVSKIATGINSSGGIDVASGFVYAVEQSTHNLVRVPTSGGTKTVVAGGGAIGLVDGTGAAARFSAPRDIAILGSDAYVADFGNSRIRKVTSLTGSGVVSTLPVTPSITNPAGVGAVTIAGVSYLAVVSTSTHKLMLVNLATNQSYQIAGTGTPGWADGLGGVAQFSSPSDVAAVGTTLYVCELNNKRIRQIMLAEGADPRASSSWEVATIAGDGISGTADGRGDQARFAAPRHIAIDGSGALLVTDLSSNTVRKVAPVTGVFPIAGSGGGANGIVTLAGSDGVLPNPAEVQRQFLNLGALAPQQSVEKEMNFIVGKDVTSFYFIISVVASADSTPAALDAVSNVATPFKGSPNVSIRTLYGQGLAGTISDGPPTVANFGGEKYVANSDIGLFVSDSDYDTVRLVGLDGVTHTIAGILGSTGGFPVGGTGETCKFLHPTDIAANKAGTELYVVVLGGHVVMRLSRSASADPNVPSNWTVAIIAGISGTSGNTIGDGTTTRFNLPYGIAADSSGSTLYVTDRGNHSVKKVAFLGQDKNNPAQWRVTYHAGSPAGTAGDDNGPSTAAQFRGPSDIDLADNGDLFVAEWQGHRVRKISSNQQVSLVAGSATAISTLADGLGSAAGFTDSFTVAVDNAGYLYVGCGSLIRRVTLATGEVKTVAGISDLAISNDGVGDVGSTAFCYGLDYDPKQGLIFGDGQFSIRLIERIVRNGSP